MQRRAAEIVHSLIWAAILLGGHWFLRGTEGQYPMFFLAIFGWLLSRDIVLDRGAGIRREWRCFRRRVLRRHIPTPPPDAPHRLSWPTRQSPTPHDDPQSRTGA